MEKLVIRQIIFCKDWQETWNCESCRLTWIANWIYLNISYGSNETIRVTKERCLINEQTDRFLVECFSIRWCTYQLYPAAVNRCKFPYDSRETKDSRGVHLIVLTGRVPAIVHQTNCVESKNSRCTCSNARPRQRRDNCLLYDRSLGTYRGNAWIISFASGERVPWTEFPTTILLTASPLGRLRPLTSIPDLSNWIRPQSGLSTTHLFIFFIPFSPPFHALSYLTTISIAYPTRSNQSTWLAIFQWKLKIPKSRKVISARFLSFTRLFRYNSSINKNYINRQRTI